MKKWMMAIVVMMAVGMLVTSASAAAITLNQKSLSDILGSSYSAAGSLAVEEMTADNIKADVYNQAFKKDGEDLYAYLYQVDNTGPSGYSPVEMFTVWPFTGADDTSDIGYLTGDIPTGFITTGTPQDPEDTGNVESLTSGPVISFYYGARFGKQIAVGEHSEVMYVASNLSPDTITGNVIDGNVASGPVVGPVPEPATMAILGLGGVGVLIRRRRK